MKSTIYQHHLAPVLAFRTVIIALANGDPLFHRLQLVCHPRNNAQSRVGPVRITAERFIGDDTDMAGVLLYFTGKGLPGCEGFARQLQRTQSVR
jgi:hypothetical protein